MSEELTDQELAARGWSRCEYCGSIRSPYTGLDYYNHAPEDCLYSLENGFIVKSGGSAAAREEGNG